MSLLNEPATNGAANGANGAVVNAAVNGANGTNGVSPGAAQPPTTTDGRWLVPEDMRGDYLKNFIDDKHTVDPSAILKSYSSAQQMIGRDKIPVPKTDEDWQGVYKALGRPDDASAYELKRPDKLPDGLAYSEDKEKAFRAVAHQIGLNQKQVHALYEMGLKFETEGAGHMAELGKQARDGAEAALRREWGNSYEGNVAVAKVAYTEFADPDFVQFLETSGLGNDPRMIRVFNRLGKEMMGDDKLKGAAAGRLTQTPADIDKAITEFRSKYQAALIDRYHPEHEIRTRELTAFFQQRYPAESNGVMGPA